jgi:hypothetical protein
MVRIRRKEFVGDAFNIAPHAVCGTKETGINSDTHSDSA